MLQEPVVILSAPGDETAEAIAADFRSLGQSTIELTDFKELAFSLEIDATTQTRSQIIVGGQALVPRGFINRGLATPVDIEDGFGSSEWIAGLWALLAFWPGPVVNRPDESGFLPHGRLDRLARHCVGVRRTPTDLVLGCRPRGAEGSVNIHDILDGTFLGRHSDQEAAHNWADRVAIATHFDASATSHFIIAGSNLITLSRPRLKFVEKLERVVNQQPAFAESFEYLVVMPETDALLLVHNSLFPRVHHYAHLRREVHSALLRVFS